MGEIQCWGEEEYTDAASGSFISVSSDKNGSCALTAAGALSCWGGLAVFGSDVPEGVFSDVAVGYHHACTLDSDGMASCWGVPVDPSPERAFDRIDAGSSFTCGSVTTGALECWGFDSHGQVSDAPSFD